MTTTATLSGQSGTLLVCEEMGELHGEWSATPDDYFWMGSNDRFTCECGADLIEVRRLTLLVAVTS